MDGRIIDISQPLDNDTVVDPDFMSYTTASSTSSEREDDDDSDNASKSICKMIDPVVVLHHNSSHWFTIEQSFAKSISRGWKRSVSTHEKPPET